MGASILWHDYCAMLPDSRRVVPIAGSPRLALRAYQMAGDLAEVDGWDQAKGLLRDIPTPPAEWSP